MREKSKKRYSFPYPLKDWLEDQFEINYSTWNCLLYAGEKSDRTTGGINNTHWTHTHKHMHHSTE